MTLGTIWNSLGVLHLTQELYTCIYGMVLVVGGSCGGGGWGCAGDGGWGFVLESMFHEKRIYRFNGCQPDGPLASLVTTNRFFNVYGFLVVITLLLMHSALHCLYSVGNKITTTNEIFRICRAWKKKRLFHAWLDFFHDPQTRYGERFSS